MTTATTETTRHSHTDFCVGYIGGGRIVGIYRCARPGSPRVPGGKPLCDAHAKVGGRRIYG